MNQPASRTRYGIFILLRRLRKPLTVLIGVYAIAVLGFTLVPGVDPEGRRWTMSFLHSFYFVSFLGTTIGLGEIPFPFSDAQRMWATASIYGTVVAWLYAIGGLFSVLQDPLFRRIADENAVERAVRRMSQPFYLVCGYDDAGHRVARELTEDGARLVVIDTESTRVDSVEVDELSVAVPALCGDASDPKTLVLAGLTSPYCAGVLALTGDDFINTKIALTARLLSPDIPVLSAVRYHAAHARMAAAGADHIINPYELACHL
jgi:voltage-gated potassium channel